MSYLQSRMRRAGYVEKMKVYVDYEGRLTPSRGSKVRREPFHHKRGIIKKIKQGGAITIVFDTFEPRTQEFRTGFTLSKVGGGIAPYVVPKYGSRKRKAPAS